MFGAPVAHHATFPAGLRLTLLTCVVLLLATAAAALALPAGARRTA
ncbi:MAG: hypothetical protein ACRDPO_31295 [Streptosporangiaceae bacterium]